jgi:hypothetical protein
MKRTALIVVQNSTDCGTIIQHDIRERLIGRPRGVRGGLACGAGTLGLFSGPLYG